MRISWILAVIACAAASVPSGAVPADLQALIAGAADGAVIRLPAGTYSGPIVVNRTVRIIGEPGAIIEGNGKGSVIRIVAPDVELAHVLVRHSGSDLANDDAGIHIESPRAVISDNVIVDCLHGIYVKAANDCRVVRNVVRGRSGQDAVPDPLVSGLKLTPAELCSSEIEQNQRGNGIHVWKADGLQIVGNDIRGTRDGIYFSFATHTRVTNNRVSGVRYGLHYMYSDANVFEDNVFTNNAAGSALMFSKGIVLRRNHFLANRSARAYGILMHSVDNTEVIENTIEGNTVGMFVECNTGGTIERNRIANNYIGLRINDSSSGNLVVGNEFVHNVHPTENDGLNQANTWTRDGRGNFWDGALRVDLNGDGVADVPHHEVDLFGRWRRSFPAIGLLSGSPGDMLVRFIYNRVAVRGLSGITDPAPLVKRPAP